MKNKDSGEELIKWLNDDVFPKFQFSTDDQIELIVNCLLQNGSKSFSHLLNILDRYFVLLRHFISTPQQQVQCIHVIHSYWKTSSQFIVITINKFLSHRVLEAASIAQWIFSESIIPLGKRQYIWEIMTRTIDKSLDSVALGEQKLSEMDDPTEKLDATEEEIKNYEVMKDKLEQARDEKKLLFQVIFQRFSMVLNEYLQTNAGKDDNWYKMTLGHLKLIGRRYYKHIRENLSTLELLFTNVDPQIADVFQQIKLMVINY
eukprot:TRINITY_DN555_c0_g1_i6.p1 TRINITY_DN555_c0_g1~~TRINITY_DN555_c0_g1_i6.p1  ORF type:complete len:260 (-),score=46.05 TRINITY_DN555_c0_g1_i6:9-788(-)